MVKLSNPISSETEYLRQAIWPNLAEVVDRNLRKGFKDIAIFEIGKVFENDKKGEPKEQYTLAITLCNGSDNPLEELLTIAKELDLNIDFKQTEPKGLATTLVHPKRYIALEKDNVQVGGLSEIHLRVLNKLGIEKRVATLELYLS